MFEDADVVSTYTDADALRDGVLVSIAGSVPFPINRATRAVFDAFTQPIGKLPGGLGGSPVTDIGLLSQLGEAVKAKMKAGDLQEGMVVLEFQGRTVWAMPNETTYRPVAPYNVPGWTIMFPEDY